MSTEDQDGFEACSLLGNEEFFSCLGLEGRYLDAHGKFTTASKFKTGTEWSKERIEIHKAVFERLIAKFADIPCDHRAIFIGGESGVGKTHFRKTAKGLSGNYLISDADLIRKELILELMRRGEMPEIDDRFEKYLGRDARPFELSGLFHLESQVVTAIFEAWAISEGKNIIFDNSLANEEYVFSRLRELHDQNYAVVGILMQGDPETTNARRVSRYFEESTSTNGLGGRPIPKDFAELVRKKAPRIFEEARRVDSGFQLSLILDASSDEPRITNAWLGQTELANLPQLSELDLSPDAIMPSVKNSNLAL